MARLQVALDFLDMRDAIQIAGECSDAHILEAGTPLIKSEGLKVVSELKNRFPDKMIVADMKTMDTGYLETEAAAKAKADMISILALADDETIKGAVKAGKEFGIKVSCDLINVGDPVRRSRELETLGVDYLSLHLGIDQQKKSGYPFPTLKRLCSEVKIPVSAAGGITDSNVQDVIKAGAEIVVIGGFITRSKDPANATKLVLGRMV